MARNKIERYRGDTSSLVLKLTQNKQVFDLTGFSAKLSVSSEEKPIGSTYVLQSTAVVDVAAGSLTFPFTADDVDHVGDFYYDVELIDGDGKTKTIRKDQWIFEQDITK